MLDHFFPVLPASSKAATISFLRHAEMKHGRIAMIGFWGYMVQASGIHFPWATEANGFPPASLSPPEQWEVFSPFGKFQLFFFIGCLELWSEAAPGAPHYMRGGGVPGKFPPFVGENGERLPFLPIDLWDPTGATQSMTPEVNPSLLGRALAVIQAPWFCTAPPPPSRNIDASVCRT